MAIRLPKGETANRLFYAGAMIALAVSALIWAPIQLLDFVLLVPMQARLLYEYEHARVARFNRKPATLNWLLPTGVAVVLDVLILYVLDHPAVLIWVNYCGLALMTAHMVSMHAVNDPNNASDRIRNRTPLEGFLWISFLLISLPLLIRMEQGRWWVVLAITVAAVTDSSGYFAKFGKNKMDGVWSLWIVGALKRWRPQYSKTSPNKTWEGAVTQFFCGALSPWVVHGVMMGWNWYALNYGLPESSILGLLPWYHLVGIGIPGAYLAMRGDMVGSWFKRLFKASFPKLIGEHGAGIDRMDSIIYVATYVCAYLRLVVGLG